MKEEVTLLLCGSFNPVTIKHLRMFEIARDHLQNTSNCVVNRGILSPVHDGYKKGSLIPVTHRIAMLKLALESSDWLQLSTWESEQAEWTRTYHVLRHHREELNNLKSDSNMNTRRNSSRDVNGNPNNSSVTVKMVCGGDCFASFLIPNLWTSAELEGILVEHGLVIITRDDYDVDKIYEMINEHDLLFKHRKRICIVKEFMGNAISSTEIRRACSRGLSIRYLVPDAVERYIKMNNLYSMNSCSNSVTVTSNSLNGSQNHSKNVEKAPVSNLKNIKEFNEKKRKRTKTGHSSRRSKM